MRINWGTGIVIAFILFIGFILFFVIMASTSKKYDYDLVSEEYYKDELNYQTEIDQLENVRDLNIEIIFKQSDQGVEIFFPNDYLDQEIKGNLSLYRPSNQRLDFDIPFVLSKHTSLLIPDKKLVGGRWDISISWTKNGKDYLYKKEFIY